MSSLTQYQVVIDREQWIKEAEDAEQSGAKLTCAAIVRNTIHLGWYEPYSSSTVFIGGLHYSLTLAHHQNRYC